MFIFLSCLHIKLLVSCFYITFPCIINILTTISLLRFRVRLANLDITPRKFSLGGSLPASRSFADEHIYIPQLHTNAYTFPVKTKSKVHVHIYFYLAWHIYSFTKRTPNFMCKFISSVELACVNTYTFPNEDEDSKHSVATSILREHFFDAVSLCVRFMYLYSSGSTYDLAVRICNHIHPALLVVRAYG